VKMETFFLKKENHRNLQGRPHKETYLSIFHKEGKR
jgi:hypothetical protein